MTPKHQSPTRWKEGRKERTAAIAPYNFVALPDSVVSVDLEDLPKHDTYQGNSGWITCTLTTASPTYVRGLQRPTDYATGEKLGSEFFHTGNQQQPAIPGSSLRGLFRTLVEIVSYSKFFAVSNQSLVYRAVGDTTNHGKKYREKLFHSPKKNHYEPNVLAGYIELNGYDYVIRPAKKINDTTFAVLAIRDIPSDAETIQGCKNAQRLYITPPGEYEFQSVKGSFLQVKQARVSQANSKQGPGLLPATLAKSGRMSSKLNEAVVFEKDDAATTLAISDELINLYKNQLLPEQVNLLGENGVLQDGQPVFYLLDETGKLLFFGHTRMFRLPYKYTPFRLLPDALNPSKHLDHVDIAESVFGYVGKGTDNRDSFAGRVFFTDAQLAGNQSDIWLVPNRELTPQVLSTPKPTTFQHYLVQTQPDWVKSGETKTGESKYETELQDYSSAPEVTTLRGYKQYWHRGAVTADAIREKKPVKDNDTQHTKIQPVKAGVSFTFKIHFENLKDAELGALLWILQVAGDEKYRLKLGMGKPLGLGAVKVTGEVTIINRQARYTQLFAADGWHQASQVEPNRDTYVQAFETFMLEKLGLSTLGKSFRHQPRIEELLILLAWPGPDPQATRYMEIERYDPNAKNGKRNEYDGRPVLPNPLDVGKPVREQEPVEKLVARDDDSGVQIERYKPPLEPLPEVHEQPSRAAMDLFRQFQTRSAETEAEEVSKREKRDERKKKKK